MYRITSKNTFAGYADSVVLIKLHRNGCYKTPDQQGRETYPTATVEGGNI